MKKVKGFTLIELIVVIIIVGTLAAILTPIFFGMARDSRVSKYQAQARHVYEAAQLGLTGMRNAGTVYNTNDIYIGGADGIGKCSGSDDCDLFKYLGGAFDGYFGFVVDDAGIGVSYAVWSDKPLSESDIVYMEREDVVDNISTVLPRGCYFPGNE